MDSGGTAPRLTLVEGGAGTAPLAAPAVAWRASLRRRAACHAIACSIWAGCLLLWIGVPAGWLWLAGEVGAGYRGAYGLAVLLCPVSMALLALGLARLDDLRLRLLDAPRPPSSELLLFDPHPRRNRPILEAAMVVSVMVAFVAFAVWAAFALGS